MSSTYDLSAWPLFRSVIDDPRDDATRSRRCHVASPTEDSNPDVRRHAETLWKYVIRPALLDTDYSANRIDPDQAGERVPQAAIDALLDDDLIIAVLSFQNPQIYYQTAVAQAAARPLILMIEEGQPLQIDPRGARVVTYSLDTDAVFSAVNVRKLQAAIREITEADEPGHQLFRPGGGALNGGASGGATVYERSSQFTYDQRLNMMREAGARIDMMGVANMAFALHPDAIEVVRQRSGQGLEIRILQCAPTNPGLVSLIGSHDMAQLNAVKAEIEAAADAWRRIVEMRDIDIAITVRRTQNAMPLSSAVITDKGVVATPYLHSLVTAESPTLFANAGTSYHRVMSQEFDALWSEATTLLRGEPGQPPRHQTPANANTARGSEVHRTQSSHPVEPLGDRPSQPSTGGLLRGFASMKGHGQGG